MYESVNERTHSRAKKTRLPVSYHDSALHREMCCSCNASPNPWPDCETVKDNIDLPLDHRRTLHRQNGSGRAQICACTCRQLVEMRSHLGADGCTIHDCVATVQLVCIIQALEAFVSRLITGINYPPTQLKHPQHWHWADTGVDDSKPSVTPTLHDSEFTCHVFVETQKSGCASRIHRDGNVDDAAPRAIVSQP